MENNNDNFKVWSKPILDKAVEDLMNNKILNDSRIEARSVWGITGKILLAQIREYGNKNDFRWLITGDEFPVDQVPGNIAESPREAARHFTLKWQLGAEKVRTLSDPEKQELGKGADLEAMSAELSSQAEALYTIVENDNLW